MAEKVTAGKALGVHRVDAYDTTGGLDIDCLPSIADRKSCMTKVLNAGGNTNNNQPAADDQKGV